MAKTKISEFSATPANNTDIDSINISEGCAPSGINDAIRELMAQLKDFQTGAQGDSFNGPVGTSTAAAGAFTTLSATGAITSTLATGTAPLVIASTTKVANLNVDLLDGADWASPAALGSTTPAAVSATTLSASSTVTLSGGTANGVAYLNGSKVVTSGSALTFDGTNFTAPRTQVTTAGTPPASGAGIEIVGGTTPIILTYNRGTSAYLPFTQYGSAFTWSINGVSSDLVLTSTGLGIGTSSPSQKLHVRQDQAAYTWSRVDNQSSSASAYAGMQVGAFGNSWGIAIGSSAANSNALTFVLDAGGANAEKMRLDSSGNLGLGVTPSAWGTAKAFQIGGSGFSLSSNGAGSGDGSLTWNGYYNGTNWIYSYTGGVATRYRQNESGHAWYTAPSGTAGDAISFTQSMTLTSGGDLWLGATSTSVYEKFVLNGRAYLTNQSAPGTPTGGGVLYVEGGALKYKGSSGTVTTLAAA